MRFTNFYNISRQTLLGFSGSLIGAQREAEVLVRELLISNKPKAPDSILLHE